MTPQGLFQSLGIRARVLILAVLPVASVVALLGYNLASSRLEDAERNLAERGALIARNLALASEFALFSQNMPLVGETLQRILQEPEVKWSAVWDSQRRAMLSEGEGPPQSQIPALIDALQHGQALPLGYYAAPIRVEMVDLTDFSGEYALLDGADQEGPRQMLGFALVEVSPHRLLARRAAIVNNSLLIALSGLVATVLLALLIGNSITDPVLRVLHAVRALQAGDLSARVRARAGGEIGSLERGVNQMADTLQRAQQTLQLRIDEATLALRHTVTELEERNRELEQAREVALRAGQERTEFLARMSHEIRTPLNAVVGFTKLLQADSTSEADSEHVRTIQSAAEQLLRVINDILQFIRLDAGAEQLESLPFSLADVLEDVIAMLGPMANEKGLELVLLLHNDLPETQHGDPARLSQIVVNLVNNAIKFTTEGQIVVEASHPDPGGDEGQIEITVRDTGIGLDATEQRRLFTAFSQVDSSITRRYGGTGLGLSIARRLVELMGGEIGVESRKGEGARFWVRLPCRECSAPAPIETAGHLAGQRMLLYDANPFVRRSLRSTLAAWGVQVFNTGRWEQLLQMLAGASSGFDALIIGLSVEEKRDDCVDRYVQALRAHHSGPVLLLSGSENWTPPDVVSTQQPLGWATKPIRRSTLRRLLGERIAPGVEAVRAAGPPVIPRRLVGMQVLVAEDNAFNRQLLRHVLEEQGAIVDEAVSGSAAVSAAAGGGYDVILTDLHMPEIDGAEAARQIRGRLGAATPPIWALTADVFGRTDVEGAEDVFDDWLLKPIDPALLIDRLVQLRRTATRAPAAGERVPCAPTALPADLCRRYRHEIGELVERLRAALAHPDPATASAPLHDLKGIVGLFGDPAQVEIAARIGREFFSGDNEAISGLLDELRHCIGVDDQGVAEVSAQSDR